MLAVAAAAMAVAAAAAVVWVHMCVAVIAPLHSGRNKTQRKQTPQESRTSTGRGSFLNRSAAAHLSAHSSCLGLQGGAKNPRGAAPMEGKGGGGRDVVCEKIVWRGPGNGAVGG